jgi:hypothetical protein
MVIRVLLRSEMRGMAGQTFHARLLPPFAEQSLPARANCANLPRQGWQ